MAKTLFSVALLATAALAAPRPDVEVVQVRQVEKRQESSIDLSDFIPTSVDLGDLSTLLPSDFSIPTDLAIPTDLDLSSLIGGIATLIPSGCVPPSELASAPTPPSDVQSAILSYTDFCNAPSFTGDVGKHYTSYLSEAEAWASSNGPALTSWLSAFQTACPYANADTSGAAGATGAADISSLLASYSFAIPSCGGATGSTAKPTGSNTAKQSGSPTSGSSGSESSGSGAAQGTNNTGAAPQQTAFAAAAGVLAGFAGMIAYL